MEPYIVPLHSSTPPPLDDDGDGEAGSEDDEFGDFGGFSVVVSRSASGFPNLGDSAPASKTATQVPNCSIKLPVNQPQSAPTKGHDFNDGPAFPLTNGYADGHHESETSDVFLAGTCSPKEEAGFADFSVFAEQEVHPWCCGFSPMGNAETWVSEVKGADLDEQFSKAVMDSEPRSRCTYVAKENLCPNVQHSDAAQPQDQLQASEDPGKQKDNWRENSHFQENKELEKDAENKPETTSLYESASEDLASLCDDFSFEGVSADLEPNVSSLVSQDDQSDWEQTDYDDYEDEELSNYRHSNSLDNSSMANLCQTEEEKGFHYDDQSATQVLPATSSHACPERDEFSDFNGSISEHHDDRECVQSVDVREQSLGSLPPSDSFADFCSAPTQQDGNRSWAEFPDQGVHEEKGQIWTQVTDKVASAQTDGYTEEREETPSSMLRRNSCQASFSCRVQQLFSASFPKVVAVEDKEETITLSALLHTKHLPENEEGELPQLCGAKWVHLGLWWPHRDVTGAVGLQFQFVGSHANGTLLRCLDVDTRNTVLIGMNKQTLSAPAAVSKPETHKFTKGPVPAVPRTKNTAAGPASELPGPRDKPDSSTDSVQAVLPSSPLNWSSRGLSSSQDDCFALNLDYFGPEDAKDSRSNRSSNTPPPGVDRELYELTMSRPETSSCPEDTLNRLMSSAAKTSTSVRKPRLDDQLSAEAGEMIARLPDLSFMKAAVLMFPTVLVPKESLN